MSSSTVWRQFAQAPPRPGEPAGTPLPQPGAAVDAAAPPLGAPVDAPLAAERASPGSALDGLTAFLDLGGPVVVLLLLLSVFALTIVLVKLWQFAQVARGSGPRIEAAVRHWQAGDHRRALAGVDAVPGAVAEVVGATMRDLARGQPDAHVRERTEQRGAALLATLRSYLRALEAVAQVAPLLGLFGTVLGMIEAFRSLEAAGARVDPADLAGGIWVALLTTAVGLAIAMPVSLVLHWFEGRIDRFRRKLEGWLTTILTHPPAEPAGPRPEAERADRRRRAREPVDAP